MPTPKGYKQSEEHKKKHLAKIRGNKNGMWKGGVYANDPKFYNKRYRALRKGASGSHTSMQWKELKHQYSFTCPSCLRKEPEIKLTIDHIIPLCKGGSNDIENIQPLCGLCNNKKHSKIIKFEFELIGKAR